MACEARPLRIRQMQSVSPPTDEEYLNELYDRFKDDEWIALQEQFNKVDDLVAAAQRAIDEGVFKQNQLDLAIEAVREPHSPSEYFRGTFINTLQRVVLGILEPHRQQLEGIPVGCLPTRTLNAGAYQTPRGGAVILLDQGVIFQLACLVRSYFAFYTWYAPEPYCRDHPRAAFGRTIQQLAAFCVSGDPTELHRITTWKCSSLPYYDQVLETFAFGIELFIMLHECGHVVLNHFTT